MKNRLIYILGFITLLLSSCEYKFIEPVEIEIPEDPIIFSTQIEPVFQDKCITCHSSTSPVLTTGNAYNNLINGNYINTEAPESSKLYEKVNGDHPGGNNSLSAEELAIILKWIEDSAENN